MTRITPANLLQGQAGVYQVASQLCLRGFNPHFPAVDIGADLVVDGGIRIQIKAAHLRLDKVYPQGAYWFKLGRTAIRHRTQVWEAVNFTDFCDFAVFWGIEQTRFWIVPASALDGHQCLVLGPVSTYCDIDIEAVKRMQSDGLRQEDIGNALGVSQMTISRRTRGLFTKPLRTLRMTIDQYENRWDLIQGYLDSLHQANSFVSPLELAVKEKQYA
jgi:hypothetical protein